VPVQTVGIVIHDGVQALDVAGPADVFAEANAFLAPDDHYEVILVASSLDPVRASNGTRMAADRPFDQAPDHFDILLVAGGPDLPYSMPDPRLTGWLSEAAHRAITYGSICTGAFTLGHAGLLDGRRVTTHWQCAARLAARFPAAKVEEDAIYIRDGALVTSAGVTAGIDLALYLLHQRHGTQISLAVAKRLVVLAQRQGGQSQFSPFLASPADVESPVRRVQDHIVANIGERHTLGSLAGMVGMSPRSLARHFVQETGTTPHEFLDSARIDAARRLLEASPLPLKAIAADCGFGTPDRMRIIFQDRLGITAAQYRASFQRQAPAH
jgi:transcriptional regulator GlxA family with amidase domain